MPTGNLESVSLLAPGFMGLNTNDAKVGLSSGFATQADNLVLDKAGRLSSRQGHKVLNVDDVLLPDTEYIDSIWRHDTTYTDYYMAAGNDKIFVGDLDSSGTFAKLKDITPSGTSPNGSRWQFQTLPEGSGDDAVITTVAVQKGNTPLVFTTEAGELVGKELSEVGTFPTGTKTTWDPDVCLAAYGRIWTANATEDKDTIWYSDLLEPTNFSTENAGILDISSVIGNNDVIIGLAQHNNYLVIFCRDNIVVYEGAEDPDTMKLADVITGIGCLSRDSIKATGTDLIFMSQSGVRSLARTVQEKSMPMRELTLNMKDTLNNWLRFENKPEDIRAGYSEDKAFYVVMLPFNKKMVYIDLRMVLENGAARCCTWSTTNGNLFNCFFDDTTKREFLIGVKGGIARYEGNTDNFESYDIVYRSTSSDLGGEGQTVAKFVKRATLTIEGAKQQDFVMKYGYDYTRNPRQVVVDRDLGSGVYARYSMPTSLYGVSKYSPIGIGVHRIKVPLGGSGESFYFGLEATIYDELMSIQKIDIFLKTGKRS